ncbi:vir-repressed protein [Vogesella facilis]|uniref:Vir-repressed protein n=1 Tax=Vogesella facilis TaxID=1655232 RepID=A0ABV7RJC1_9NEIS
MKTLLFALIAAGSLSACVVQPARVHVRSPIVLEPARVVVPVYGSGHYHDRYDDDDDDRGYYRGGFCPPGQAMKGRC